MPKYTSAELDKKVLNFVRAKRNTNTFKVSQHFGIKWETADRSLKRLQADCKVFYEPEVKIWSIYAKVKVPRAKKTGQQSKEREISHISTGTTFAISHSGLTLVRGKEGEVEQKPGFVCHPKTKGDDLSDQFVRMHLNGQYLIKIEKTGSMPESFADSDSGISVTWYERKMNGNYGYFGRVGFPDDPKTFNIQSLGTKDKGLTTLGIYIHPRYIYHKECKLTAEIEFRTQIAAVLKVLEAFGWKFGEVKQSGTMHYGLNNHVLPSMIPVNHVEKSTDAIHFDSSVKDGKDGFCTEAELFDDHAGAENEVEFWVGLPKSFATLAADVGGLRKEVDGLTIIVTNLADVLKENGDQTTKLALAVQELADMTKLNTSVLLGNVPTPSKEPLGYIAHPTKEDVMYG